MKKIGIMGGTFNPIHNVHLIMAEMAYHQYDLDQVLFMPSKNPPHKDNKEIVSDEHRTRMIQLAIDGNSHFEFSDLELKREGTTYTSDTLLELRKNNPDCEYYFIIGGDSLEYLDKWHEPKVIFDNCHLLAARRGNLSKKDCEELLKFYKKTYQADIQMIEMENINISSQAIRKHIQDGESFSYYCPDKVSKYISYHGLYGLKKSKKEELSINEIHSRLKCVLRPKRFRHVLGVEYTATSLAMAHDVDLKQAELAGALHDCVKYLTGKEQLLLCEKYNIELTKVEKKNTALIHAKLGAYIAKKRYMISDKEILSAIKYHTTGRPDMTKLEKIIYISDYIEPSRKMDCKPYSLKQIRKEAFVNLDSALLMILTNSCDYLKKDGKDIDEMTLKTYEYYKKIKDIP